MSDEKPPICGRPNDPSGPRRYLRRMSLVERLLQEVATSRNDEGCWEFQGRTGTSGGYGQIWYKGKYHYVHRVSYEHYVGAIPSGYDIDHLCRNRACFRPDHLEAVTRSVNIQRGYDARKARQKFHVLGF